MWGKRTYRTAVELARVVGGLSQRIPRGHRSLAEQMHRASISCVLLIAEGANRVGAGEKRVRYGQAPAECGEVAAAVELGEVPGLLPSVEAERAVVLGGRVAATLAGLVRRLR